MGFELLDVAYEAIARLRVVVRTVERSDRDLARQIRRAASSIALNIGEAREREQRDRVHLIRIAHGSASEVRVALQVALAWGFLDLETVAPIDALLDRVGAMCWRLSGR